MNYNTAADTNSLSELASGSRIIRASDDAAGLAISSQLQATATVFQQDTVNVQQGQSLLQIADGALAQISLVLSRLLSLASESASGQVTDTQRQQDINTEYQSLVQEINSISSSAQYGGQSLLNFPNAHGAFSWNSSSALRIFYEGQVLGNTQYGINSNGQVTGETGTFTDTHQQEDLKNGANGLPLGSDGSFAATQYLDRTSNPFGPTRFLTGIGSVGAIPVTLSAMNSVTLGLESDVVSYHSYTVNTINGESVAAYLTQNPGAVVPGGLTTTVQATTSNVASQSAAMTAITVLNNAIAQVTAQRATVGAYESRFRFAEQVSQSDWQQTEASVSVLADADVAGVKARLSAEDVATQSAIAATVQAAHLPTELLKLIQS